MHSTVLDGDAQVAAWQHANNSMIIRLHRDLATRMYRVSTPSIRRSLTTIVCTRHCNTIKINTLAIVCMKGPAMCGTATGWSRRPFLILSQTLEEDHSSSVRGPCFEPFAGHLCESNRSRRNRLTGVGGMVVHQQIQRVETEFLHLLRAWVRPQRHHNRLDATYSSCCTLVGKVVAYEIGQRVAADCLHFL